MRKQLRKEYKKKKKQEHSIFKPVVRLLKPSSHSDSDTKKKPETQLKPAEEAELEKQLNNKPPEKAQSSCIIL